MSTTYHYDVEELTINKCFEILKDKKPMVIKEGDRYQLSWDEQPKNGNSRYGVWLKKVENNMSVNKGHTTIWNGQGKLLNYLSDNGVDCIYSD